MSKIKNTYADGCITIKYDVEPTRVHTNEYEPTPVFITRVAVTTYWDGDVSVSLYGVPVTKSGTPHKGRTPENLYLNSAAEAEVLADLGISATVLPVIAALVAGPQEEEE